MKIWARCAVIIGVVLYLGGMSVPGFAQEPFPLEQRTIEVAKNVGPAVVAIMTEFVQQNVPFRSFGPAPDSGDDPFNRFFEEYFGQGVPPGREFRRQGIGSGVIIDASGYILTNEHVVQQAKVITVRLIDGREFKAEVIGLDTRSDLAVIKINAADDLPVAKLGSADNLQIGQWVVVIGNPFSFAIEGSQPTVTTGVISALHRALPLSATENRQYSDLIQTDAAINPGNSGGPLCNLDGEIIGINVAIITTTGGHQGLGFAISVKQAKQVLGKLVRGEKVLYGWLGVSVQDLNEQLRRYFKVSQNQGVIVVNTVPGSPAEKSGLEAGDVILKVGGEAISGVQQLVEVVSSREPGTRTDLEVLRDGRRRRVRVELGRQPQEGGEFGQRIPSSGEEEEPAGFRGMVIEDIPLPIKQRFEVEAGVIVSYVESGSPAAEAGITTADIITHMNSQPVEGRADFIQKALQCKGECLIRTLRGFFVIPEPE